MKFDQIQNITIFGVGLIGGSLGLALKKNGFYGKITGLGRRMSTLEIALERKAVDQITIDPSNGLESAELVVIATPVDLISDSVQKLSAFVPEGCIFTDVGSIKSSIVKESEKKLPENFYFVGAHPMAGSEKRGVKASDSGLFEGATCILTPTEFTNRYAFNVVKELWKTVGANVKTMSPDIHDYLIAAASHMPHVIACVLAQTVGEVENKDYKALEFTGTGFRDTTRIAAGSPDIWEPILSDNNQSLVKMIDEFVHNLNVFKQSLIDCDKEKITELLIESKQIRDSLKR